PRWVIRVRTCPPVNRLVRLGGRKPSALRTSAIWGLFWPASASSVTRARSAGEYDSWSRRGARGGACPVGWGPPAPVRGEWAGARDGDLLDQDAQQFLAVGLGGGRGVPDLWQVAGQGGDGRPLGGSERFRLLFGEPLVVRLQPAGFGEGGLPFLFQLPDDQAVFPVRQPVRGAGRGRALAGRVQP